MICYYFPPLLDVGCKRSVAFAKYLKRHGWEPHVLSVRNPDQHYCSVGSESPPEGIPTSYTLSLFNLYFIFGKLNGLITKICSPFGIQIKRNYLHDLFSIPDLFLGWIPGAVFKGFSIIKKEKIDYIYISCTPYSSAFAGIALKKLTGKPLIIDFRDPFHINDPDIFGLPAFREKINIRLERRIIKAADVFIVNTEEVRQGYISEYPEIAHKTITIHNGFDHQMLSSGQPEKFEKFTVVYGGNMYFEAIKSNSFFEAIARLKESGLIKRENFQFLYFGSAHKEVNNIAEKLNITDLIQVSSYIPHAEMLNVLMKSHLQLLRIIKPMISTKLFEGIALNLPFLATIPPGEVADIIARYSPSSHVVHEDSPQAIGKAIMAAMNDYHLGTVENNLVTQFLANFSREKMTIKLEQAIENTLIARQKSHTAAKNIK